MSNRLKEDAKVDQGRGSASSGVNAPPGLQAPNTQPPPGASTDLQQPAQTPQGGAGKLEQQMEEITRNMEATLRVQEAQMTHGQAAKPQPNTANATAKQTYGKA